MRRRAFCASAIATIGAAALPFGRAFAAAEATTGDVSAVTGGGRRILLVRSDIEDLRASLRGQLLLADSEGYDSARRVWNGMFDRKPALIARCAGAADVMQSVKFARAHDLLLAVRGGGHSLSGQSVCNDGLMIDLSPMRSVRVDPARKLARVEPGALLGDLDRESLAFGLVTTTGTVSHTGAAGLTLGGGFGRLARRFAMTCDNVASVDIVTADGRLLQANAAENPDLFWGVRGGGGNFGVVTSFEYQLHPFDGKVFGGYLVYPFAQARDVLRGYVGAFAQAPDELWIDPAVVATSSGDKFVELDVCYSGPPSSGDQVVAPFRRFGKPIRDELKPVSYTALQASADARARVGRRYYNKSGFIKELRSDLVDTMSETIASTNGVNARLTLSPRGGAIARVAPESTAFWYRAAPYNLLLAAATDDPAEDSRITSWGRSAWPTLEAFTSGFYANTNLAEAADARGAYGGNYERLVALKDKYDPKNLFRLNANIKPSA
jgi:FAD/FMN-containing dehydrogenase